MWERRVESDSLLLFFMSYEQNFFGIKKRIKDTYILAGIIRYI